MVFLWKNKILWFRKNKVRGLNLMMVGTFSWKINNCFFIQSNLAHSCRWNSISWIASWILGFMVENKPRRIFLGLYYIQYGQWATMYVVGNCLHPN